MAYKVVHKILLLFFLLFFGSCYKEYVKYPETNDSDFNFIMTDEQELHIYESRGEKLKIVDPIPVMYYNEESYGIDKFELRGESTLKFRRKSYSVNLDDNLELYIDYENQIRTLEKFKLISLVFDYTYIEDRLAHIILKKMELWPVYSFFTTVSINDNSQGLYMFIEDPEDYFLYLKDASFILRRGYQNAIYKYELNELNITNSSDYYIARFDSIYSYITRYSGKELYDSLQLVIDIDQYFVKLAVDMVLKNGDATDEIFLYTKAEDDNKVLGVFPWDYDDLFSNQPHEINRDWAVGTRFGTRTYASMEDIIADVGEKLIYSIEDDLDYKIAKDDYLYGKYLLALNSVISKIDDSFIESSFDKIYNELVPFYENEKVILQSQYDEQATSMDKLVKNVADKKQLLIERRQWILDQLNTSLN